jgi:hypothetical protein
MGFELWVLGFECRVLGYGSLAADPKSRNVPRETYPASTGDIKEFRGYTSVRS